MLKGIAKLVRYYILTSTTAAGSGHPTSSLSAVELMVGLLFADFRLGFDRLIFSKGHAAPLLYSLFTAAGLLSKQELMSLRKFKSPIEGHARPNFPYAEVASGSLGQGLSVGLGMALNSQYLDKTKYLNFVLLGDSELAEGSNWEAIQLASYYQLKTLIGILDVKRLGQSNPTMLEWKTASYAKRIHAFGWQTKIINGHDFTQIASAYALAGKTDRPLMIIAKTVKGKGVSFLENQPNWHGKSLPDNLYQKAIQELGPINWQLKCSIKRAN